MIKELLIKATKEKLKLLIEETKTKYLSTLDTEEKELAEQIINKENYIIEDINDLLIEYFPKELTASELLTLIKPNSKLKKKISKKQEALIYIISYYLINIDKYQNTILEIIQNININDIDTLDEYLTDSSYIDNKKINEIIIKLSPNLDLQTITKELTKIFNLFNNKVIDINLLNTFLEEKIPKHDNYYFQYKEIINKLDKIDINDQKYKYILLSYFTFIDDINIFKNIRLTKEDLISFLEKIEENKIKLNENQINNLLNNFSEKYLIDNNQKKETKELINKVITTYFEYCEKNFYFKIEDFITYYNNLYEDDFSMLTYSNTKTKLNRNIFDSMFYKEGINQNIIILEKELDKYSNFKPIIAHYKITCLEDEKFYYERYRFYLIYIDKVKEYLKYKDEITIEYFILKNIPDNDRGNFYELFRTYYGDSYKKIGRNTKTITNSCNLLKKEYKEELEVTEFDKRYEILNKYKDCCIKLRCLSILNEQHLIKIMHEYEEKYFILPKKKNKHKHN